MICQTETTKPECTPQHTATHCNTLQHTAAAHASGTDNSLGCTQRVPPSSSSVSWCCSVLQCAAVCCSVLQSVAMHCSVLQSIAVRCSDTDNAQTWEHILLSITHSEMICGHDKIFYDTTYSKIICGHDNPFYKTTRSDIVCRHVVMSLTRPQILRLFVDMATHSTRSHMFRDDWSTWKDSLHISRLFVDMATFSTRSHIFRDDWSTWKDSLHISRLFVDMAAHSTRSNIFRDDL